MVNLVSSLPSLQSHLKKFEPLKNAELTIFCCVKNVYFSATICKQKWAKSIPGATPLTLATL